MKKVLVVAIAAMMLSCIACGSVTAQEEESNYAFGEIVEVTSDSITVTEIYYDEDVQENITEQVVYMVTPGTELENAGSFSELRPGQQVDLEYIESGDGKTANYVYVYLEEE